MNGEIVTEKPRICRATLLGEPVWVCQGSPTGAGFGASPKMAYEMWNDLMCRGPGSFIRCDPGIMDNPKLRAAFNWLISRKMGL